MSRRLPFRLLPALLASAALLLPGCGLVWWGAAAGAGWFLWDSSQEEEEEPLPTNPELYSLSSDTGEETGGQTVTLNGKRFQAGSEVFFGAVSASPVTFINAWMVQAVTPATTTGATASLAVNVRVRNPDGQEAVLANGYTYTDSLPPAAVADLAAAPGATDHVLLTFTAPGDNGVQGTAASYDLRWATSAITEANWASATTITGESAPLAAGSAESWDLSFAWQAGGNLYFALKTTDDSGHISPLSNAATFDPLPPDPVRNLYAFPGTQRGRGVLTFTAPADDEGSGTGSAAAYLLRYSTTPILTDAEFDAAQEPAQLPGAWTPLAAGTAEAHEVSLREFTDGQKYYFAAKAEDDVGNLSKTFSCASEMVYVQRWMLSDGRARPQPRRLAATAYDPVGQCLVVYGGMDGTPTFYNDVFTLDLKGGGHGTWKPLSTAGTGPAAGRMGSACVWDPLNRWMVIYGGHNGGTNYNEVFRLDFSQSTPTWLNITPAAGGPGQRYESAAAYDPYRKRMVVFGGRNNTTDYNDAFALDLTPGAIPSWSTLTPTSTAPSNRWGAFAAYDPVRDGMVVFGGHNGISPTIVSVNDLRMLDFSGGANGAWTAPSATNAPPPARGEGYCAYDPFTRRLYVSNGLERPSGTIRNDLWVLVPWSGGNFFWFQIPISGVPALWGDSGVFDEANQRIVFFGGTDGSNHTNFAFQYPLRSLEIEKGWSAYPTPIGLNGRWGTAMAFDWPSTSMVMFGGDSTTGYRQDTWVANVSTGGLTWQSPAIPGPPAARRGHTMVTDQKNKRVLLFGGYDGTATPYKSDVWQLVSSPSWTWNPVSVVGSPTAREQACAVYDPVNHWMIVYGGRNALGVDAQLDILSLNTLTWFNQGAQTGAGEPGRLAEACAVFDPQCNAMVLFGGEDNTGAESNETWLLDVTSINLLAPAAAGWTRVRTSTTKPSARKGAAGFWDAPNRRAVFFGGEDSTQAVNGETWALYLNGHGSPVMASGAWVQLQPPNAGPSARSNAAAALDPLNLRGIVFGGKSGNTSRFADSSSLCAPAPAPPAYERRLTLINPPTARSGCSAVLDRPNDQMILFGGRSSGVCVNAVRVLQLATQEGLEKWLTPVPSPTGTPPAAREGHAAFVFEFLWNTFMFVTCGTDGSSYYNDTRMLQYTGSSWDWNPAGLPVSVLGTPPSGRAFFAYGYDALRTRLVLFGGETAGGALSGEIWTLTASVVAGPGFQMTWAQRTAASTVGYGPAPRKHAKAVMLDGITFVLVGGEGASGMLDDAWMLLAAGSGAGETFTWIPMPLTGSAMPGRRSAAVFTQPGHSGGWVYGGHDGSAALGDFWGYKALGSTTGTWFQPGIGGSPSLLSRAAVVYDERSQRALVFGGLDGSGQETNGLWAIDLFQPAGR
jgi:hypothetical protein